VTTLSLGACLHVWARSIGTSQNSTDPNVRPLFFPQTQALGIDCGNYDPAVYRMIVYAGTKHPSFAQGSKALAELAGLTIQEKQAEHVTKRIGLERVTERDWDVQAYLELPLMEKVRSHIDQSVDLAVIEMDGGWLQIFDRRVATVLSSEDDVHPQGMSLQDEQDDEEPCHGHWREDKIAVLMTVTSESSATDPCAEIPDHFVDPTRILKLVREIKSGVSVAERDEPGADDGAAESEIDTEATWTPRPEQRATVATCAPAKRFKGILAQAAWALGFATAKRKAFVADGAAVNWTTHKQWFSDLVAILDFIHVLVVYLRGRNGREIVPRRLGDVRRLDSKRLEWSG
jgi:hypothetical protein